MLFLLTAGVIAIAVHTPQVYAATELKFDTTTYVEHYTTPDSFFDVFLEISDVTNLCGFDIKISWDPTLIAYNSESIDTYLNAIWGTSADLVTHEAGTNATNGYYRYVALSLPSTPYTGTNTLLKLNFKVLNPGTNSKKETLLHFEINKLSDQDFTPIANSPIDSTVQIWGTKPTLSLVPTKTTCKILDEQFDVAVVVSGAVSVTGFNSEIDYNTTLLDFVSGTVDYGAGTITPDEVNGKITVTTTGTASGDVTLVTITFKANFVHIWRDEHTILTWKNNQTGSIHLQTASLIYPDPQPPLSYTSGQINYGGDVTYKWSPIQGDVTLDGKVNIDDLVRVAGLYDQDNDTYNLTGTGSLIDIYDLVVIANNFWYVDP
jgi:hypothetical protein